MTSKELAAMLNGREYGGEIFPEEEMAAEEAGLVVVYGCSDDYVEFCGAINYEVGSYDGGTVYLTRSGVLESPPCECAEDCDCPYFDAARKKAKTIRAMWHDEGGPCWTFETDIPHETFTIFEDGEPFCVGIVFSMKDIPEETK